MLLEAKKFIIVKIHEAEDVTDTFRKQSVIIKLEDPQTGDIEFFEGQLLNQKIELLQNFKEGDAAMMRLKLGASKTFAPSSGKNQGRLSVVNNITIISMEKVQAAGQPAAHQPMQPQYGQPMQQPYNQPMQPQYGQQGYGNQNLGYGNQNIGYGNQPQGYSSQPPTHQQQFNADGTPMEGLPF